MCKTHIEYQEIGEWGSFNIETKEVSNGGKMYSKTTKAETLIGDIKINSEWITDKDIT